MSSGLEFLYQFFTLFGLELVFCPIEEPFVDNNKEHCLNAGAISVVQFLDLFALIRGSWVAPACLHTLLPPDQSPLRRQHTLSLSLSAAIQGLTVTQNTKALLRAQSRER